MLWKNNEMYSIFLIAQLGIGHLPILLSGPHWQCAAEVSGGWLCWNVWLTAGDRDTAGGLVSVWVLHHAELLQQQQISPSEPSPRAPSRRLWRSPDPQSPLDRERGHQPSPLVSLWPPLQTSRHTCYTGAPQAVIRPSALGSVRSKAAGPRQPWGLWT